ncbi:MAG: DUF1553 domain-containing protein, partial [Planctomycetota bacterium]
RFKPGKTGHFAVTYDGSGKSEGIELYLNGQRQKSRFVNEWFDTLSSDFLSDAATLRLGGKDPESGLVPTINGFALFERSLTEREVTALFGLAEARKIEAKPVEKRSDDETKKLRAFFAAFHPGPARDALIELSDARTRLSLIESRTPTTLVMNEKDAPATAHILARGEYEQKGDEVAPAPPAFLPEIEGEFAPDRLGLAQWLVHPEHPLTARVAVNRIWQELFGVGLVKTSEDFGTQGESPSHPRLLDWLATEFVDSGWDVKHLYKTILMSETYRQSSVIPEGIAKRDPENRLLARGPRFRLDAEVIRDQALAVSGLLDTSMGGSGVKPYQQAGIWEAVGYTNSNTQTFFQDFGPSAEHRRSIYNFWKRTAHPANLAIFDAPNREICVMRRERTNTPLQALVLMNDPQFVRASRFFALRVLTEAEDRESRLDRMGMLLRGRAFSETEKQVFVNSINQFRDIYASDEKAAEALLVDEVNVAFSVSPTPEVPAPELAAWIMAANQALNLDEFITKN